MVRADLRLLAGLAVPDTDGVALDGDLTAEGASVASVLAHFHLLDLWEGVKTLAPLLVALLGDRSRRTCFLREAP